MTAAKERSLRTGRNGPGLVEFQRTKTELVARQNKILAKRRLVKELIQEAKEAEPDPKHGARQKQMLEMIWKEVCAIRDLLQKRAQ